MASTTIAIMVSISVKPAPDLCVLWFLMPGLLCLLGRPSIPDAVIGAHSPGRAQHCDGARRGIDSRNSHENGAVQRCSRTIHERPVALIHHRVRASYDTSEHDSSTRRHAIPIGGVRHACEGHELDGILEWQSVKHSGIAGTAQPGQRDAGRHLRYRRTWRRYVELHLDVPALRDG